MKQCTDNQRNSYLEYIKQEMIMFDILDNGTELKNKNNKSIRKTSDTVNRTLRIMQQYYEQEDEQNDLPTTTAAIHQSEMYNYLKFGIDKLNESCSSNSSSSADQEYNPLHFRKHHHTLSPRLAKIVKRVL